MNKVIDIDERRAAASTVDRALRLLIVDRRMKMGDVAARAGFALPTLYGKLRGDGPLELHEVRRLARAFDMTVTDFIRIGESTTRQWAARDSNPEPAGSVLVVSDAALAEKALAEGMDQGARSDVAA